MIITVTQQDSELASSGVEVYMDGVRIAVLKRGESVKRDVDTDRCIVCAECGVYRKQMTIGTDANLVIKWAVKPPDMLLERAGTK